MDKPIVKNHINKEKKNIDKAIDNIDNLMENPYCTKKEFIKAVKKLAAIRVKESMKPDKDGWSSNGGKLEIQRTFNYLMRDKELSKFYNTLIE